MECRVCGNKENNKVFQIREMQHCMKVSFPYFQCARCLCIQIVSIPDDIGQYYPDDYYSFNDVEADKLPEPRSGYFRQVQADYLLYGKFPLLGRLFTIGYITPRVIHWLNNLQLTREASILDIGCGIGVTLKKIYQLGFKNLTGVDPFIKDNYRFSESFQIQKKDPLQLREDHPFDCIMMHHSFEHMEFQMEMLKKCKKLLKPGGKLLIRIPVFSKVLFNRYGVDLVSLDAPRHFYIHSLNSMERICRNAGLQISHIEHDADESTLWASEQYKKGICLFDDISYGNSRDRSIFSKKDIEGFKKEIKTLNARGESDTAAFYITVAD